MTDRQLHFNAFPRSSGHHEAAWRPPESGLFRIEYTGRTLREHYGIPQPDSLFAAPSARAVPDPVG